jgi:GNAT superfamily N-acetyltransferase
MLETMTQSETLASKSPVTFEPGTLSDSYAVFLVFERAYADLTLRLGISEATSIADPEKLAHMWEVRRPMYEHLATTADQFWLAKRGQETVGFSRSIVRDGLRLLTEFFVLPGEQSTGLGRELLARALPPESDEQRWLLATGDVRAQALYLKYGLYPSFPAYYFWRQPRPLPPPETDLVINKATASTRTIRAMGDIDAQLLGHRRDVDHRWLLSDRQGFLYLRAGEPVGYGYSGPRTGPFALLSESDFTAVLAHAESMATQLGRRHFGLEVPMANHHAVNYLLRNGFRIDNFIAHFMSNGPVGRFSNYIMTSPPFIL